ncbi:MAG: DUF2892 domain-containing protein [Deferrisomatales bacterium]|nr:DUF2892 domain-containing protein [Deferrisomatales bacterium]
MTHNVCSMSDRIFRVALGVLLLSLWFVIEGAAAYLALVGLVPIATAVVGYCPISQFLGISTCSMKESHT